MGQSTFQGPVRSLNGLYTQGPGTVVPLTAATPLREANASSPTPTEGEDFVTCRRRQSTASGVTFVTLKDGTGTISALMWRATAEKYRRQPLGATLPMRPG